MGPRQSAHWYPCCNSPKATAMVLAVGPLVPNLSLCQTSVHRHPQATIPKFPYQGGQTSGMLGPRSRRNQPQVSSPSSSEDEGTGKIEKANKNWKSGNAGASGGQPQRTGGYSQGNRPGNPQFHGGRSHPAPAQNTGPGPRTSGPGNQRRTRFAAVQLEEQDSEVMADQQGQESAQQADRSDPTASRNQSSGN